jgi:hypothetical protein
VEIIRSLRKKEVRWYGLAHRFSELEVDKKKMRPSYFTRCRRAGIRGVIRLLQKVEKINTILDIPTKSVFDYRASVLLTKE